MNEQPLPRCQHCGHVLGRRDKKCALCGTVLENTPRSSALPDRWVLTGGGLILLAVSISMIVDRPRLAAGVQTQEAVTHRDSGSSAGAREAPVQPEPRGEQASGTSAPDHQVERGNKERALQALASGQVDLRSGLYDAAIREFTEALHQDPNYGTALVNRGLAHLLKADYDRAVQDFTAAIQLQPNSDLFANRALAHFNKAEYDRAIQDYTEAISLSSSDPELFNYRGASYAGRRDYDRAIQDYDQAIRFKPDYPMALNNRGWAYSQKGDRERAIADYLSALKLKPEDRLRQHLEAALKSLSFQATMAHGQ